MLFSVIKMQKTKLAIIVAVAVTLSIAALGVVYAQYNTAQTNLNTRYSDNDSFLGWMGRCLRGQTCENYQCQNNGQCQDNYACQPTNCHQTNLPQTTIPPQTQNPPTYAPQYPNQGYCQTGYRRSCGW